MSEIISRIRELREKSGLSRAKLAQNIDEKEDKIESIEYGRQRITTDFAVKISEYFDISLDWLMTGKERTSKIGDAWKESNTLGTVYRKDMKPGGVIQTSNGEELIEIP